MASRSLVFGGSTLGGGVGVAAAVLGILCAGCGHQGVAHPRDLREVLMAYDDNRPTAALTFPTTTYEALVRF